MKEEVMLIKIAITIAVLDDMNPNLTEARLNFSSVNYGPIGVIFYNQFPLSKVF
jgi:hypothetical protein